MPHKIILASASKRRSRILRECGIRHTRIISNANETFTPNKSISHNVLANAVRKALSVVHKKRTGYIIGADTIVSFNKHILGKPRSVGEARKFLRSYSGKTLVVFTGVCIIDVAQNKTVKDIAQTKVHVKTLTPKIIQSILTHLNPLDRAGGFSIEGVGSFIFDSLGRPSVSHVSRWPGL